VTRPASLLAVAALAACFFAACWPGQGSERLGDEAYGAGRYREAFTAYRSAAENDPVARVWAKLGAAALRIGDLSVAADAYLRLAGEDPTREDEAAEGLETVARSAERSNNRPALEAAVAGLEAVGPERIAGSFALTLAREHRGEAADLVALLPAAIAAAGDPRSVDSLLGAYAAALRATGGCGPAVPVFRAVIRRSRDQALLDSAGAGIIACTNTLIPEPPAAPDATVDSMGVP
jgi:tetratricopeptide (TPR) repeat protein